MSPHKQTFKHYLTDIQALPYRHSSITLQAFKHYLTGIQVLPYRWNRLVPTKVAESIQGKHLEQTHSRSAQNAFDALFCVLVVAPARRVFRWLRPPHALQIEMMVILIVRLVFFVVNIQYCEKACITYMYTYSITPHLCVCYAGDACMWLPQATHLKVRRTIFRIPRAAPWRTSHEGSLTAVNMLA